MKTVFYVSEKTPAALADPGHAADIVSAAQARNPPLGVTGALMSAGRYFAQVLEGPDEAVDAIMASICKDARHEKIVILRESPVDHRLYSDWGLAYLGEATYVAGLVEAAIRDPATPLYAERITRFMREFAHDEKPVRPWGGGLNARAQAGLIRPT